MDCKYGMAARLLTVTTSAAISVIRSAAFLLHSCYRFCCTVVTIFVAPPLPFLLHFSMPVTPTTQLENIKRQSLFRRRASSLHRRWFGRIILWPYANTLKLQTVNNQTRYYSHQQKVPTTNAPLTYRHLYKRIRQ